MPVVWRSLKLANVLDPAVHLAAGNLPGIPARPWQSAMGQPIVTHSAAGSRTAPIGVQADMHKFKIGEVLDLLPSHGSSSRRAGECKIVALLPFEGHVVQYKVQAKTESHLRIVSESDLRPTQ